MRRLSRAAVAALLSLLGARAEAQPDPTLNAVRARDAVVCGVGGQTPGFAAPDSGGTLRGLEVDSCRAIAAAVLGDPDKARFRLLLPALRLSALQSGEVDVLFANTTWTLGREANLGAQWASITFFDGQAFLVRRALGVASAAQLDGATICMLSGGTSELNVTDWFRARNLRFAPVLIENGAELRTAFLAGRCDAMTNDSSALASFRSTLGDRREDYVLLPEIISNEPLGAAVRKGDGKWFDIVRWTHYALVTAEALGVTRDTLDAARRSTNPSVQRLLGVSGGLGGQLGLHDDWAARALRATGNFGEIWERHVTPLGVTRGPNRIWTEGGLQYAPPMR